MRTLGTVLVITEFLLEWFACGLTLRHINELFLLKEFMLKLPVMVVWFVTCILQILVQSILFIVASDSISSTTLSLAASRCFSLYHIKLINL